MPAFPEASIDSVRPFKSETNSSGAGLVKDLFLERPGGSERRLRANESRHEVLPLLFLSSEPEADHISSSQMADSSNPDRKYYAEEISLRALARKARSIQPEIRKSRPERREESPEKDEYLDQELIISGPGTGETREDLPETAKEFAFENKRAAAASDADRRYLFGVELALAAMVAISGIVPARKAERQLKESQAKDDSPDACNAGALPRVRRTHVVKAQDTLQDIAETIYRAREVAWLIADINSANIKEEWIEGARVVELKRGQALELPEPQEAHHFISRLREDFNVDRLITIMTDSVIDSRILQRLLGSISGCARPQIHINCLSTDPS